MRSRSYQHRYRKLRKHLTCKKPPPSGSRPQLRHVMHLQHRSPAQPEQQQHRRRPVARYLHPVTAAARPRNPNRNRPGYRQRHRMGNPRQLTRHEVNRPRSGPHRTRPPPPLSRKRGIAPPRQDRLQIGMQSPGSPPQSGQTTRNPPSVLPRLPQRLEANRPQAWLQ